MYFYVESALVYTHNSLRLITARTKATHPPLPTCVDRWCVRPTQHTLCVIIRHDSASALGFSAPVTILFRTGEETSVHRVRHKPSHQQGRQFTEIGFLRHSAREGDNRRRWAAVGRENRE